MGAQPIRIAKQAAWLFGCAVFVVPHIAQARTSQMRLTVGVSVVAPCVVGTRAGISATCADRQPPSARLREAGTLNPPAHSREQYESSAISFVEYVF